MIDEVRWCRETFGFTSYFHALVKDSNYRVTFKGRNIRFNCEGGKNIKIQEKFKKNYAIR